jgi:hypothetical protein
MCFAVADDSTPCCCCVIAARVADIDFEGSTLRVSHGTATDTRSRAFTLPGLCRNLLLASISQHLVLLTGLQIALQVARWSSCSKLIRSVKDWPVQRLPAPSSSAQCIPLTICSTAGTQHVRYFDILRLAIKRSLVAAIFSPLCTCIQTSCGLHAFVGSQLRTRP